MTPLGSSTRSGWIRASSRRRKRGSRTEPAADLERGLDRALHSRASRSFCVLARQGEAGERLVPLDLHVRVSPGRVESFLCLEGKPLAFLGLSEVVLDERELKGCASLVAVAAELARKTRAAKQLFFRGAQLAHVVEEEADAEAALYAKGEVVEPPAIATARWRFRDRRLEWPFETVRSAERMKADLTCSW